MSNRKSNAHIIPETVDPETVKCMRVYFPDDPLYSSALIDSLLQLSQWTAWERDAEKRAKDVAAVWKPLIEQTIDEYLSGGGCGVVDVRQNPDIPCQLEKTSDGQYWQVFAYLTDCLDLRNQVLPGIYPVPPAGETSEEAAADDIMVWWFYIVDQMIDAADSGGTEAELIELHRQIVEPITPGFPVFDGGEKLAKAILAKTAAERAIGRSGSDWQGLYEGLSCYAESDGHWLNRAADYIYDFLNDSSDWLLNALDVTAAAIGGAGLTRASYTVAGEGGGGWTSPDCFGGTLLDTLSVYANDPTFKFFDEATVIGTNYRIEVSGGGQYWGGSSGSVDGWGFYLREPMVKTPPLYFYDDLPVHQFNPADYISSHIYKIVYPGDGNTWGIHFGDSNYGDNAGVFTVKLYEA